MATPFDAAGYDDLRSYVLNNWNWIAIVDSAGNEVLRWDIQSNSNVSITSDATGNPATVELTITGQDVIDAGYSLPITITQTEAYPSSSSTDRFGYDPMADATLEIADDTVSLTHNFYLPSN